MIIRVAGFMLRLFLGVVTFVGGIFVILYAVLWDFFREKILRKKPVENPCFEKVNTTDDIPKPEPITAPKKQ